MEVGAHFDTVDCGAWGFQVGCMHWGTDLLGAEGTPVAAPFDLTIIALGEYGPGPTWGQYVQGTFADGYVFYAGHLEGRPADERRRHAAGRRAAGLHEQLRAYAYSAGRAG
jgi:hypothetical protein